jgi:hypothetical protein
MSELSTTYRQDDLPSPIDRLFLRMATRYGKHWFDMWAGIPIDEVKADWYRALRGMPSKTVLAAVDYIAATKDFPPTMTEFIKACKASQPQTFNKALPHYASAEQIEANQRKIKEAAAKLGGEKDMKKWARDLLVRYEAGDKTLTIAQIESMKTALGMNRKQQQPEVVSEQD